MVEPARRGMSQRGWGGTLGFCVALLLLAALGAGCGTGVGPASLPDAVALTTLGVLQAGVVVQPLAAADFTPAQTGRVLHAGDRIRTNATGIAVITFFDGSTMQLEPETEVTIFQLRMGGPEAATAITVRQSAGATWSRAEPAPQASYRYQVAFGDGTVWTQDRATLEVQVSDGAGTLVRAINGKANLSGSWGQQSLQAGQENTLVPGQTPAPPRDTPAPAQRFSLRLEPPAPAWLRVVDNAGRSAGAVAPGLPVDQMPGASVGDPLATPQEVALTRMQPGSYRVVLEPDADGPFALSIAVEAQGQRIFQEVRRGTLQEGQPVLATLDVHGQGSHLEGMTLGVFAPLRETPPGLVVRTLSALDALAARPRSPRPAPTATVEVAVSLPTHQPAPTLPAASPTPSPTATSTRAAQPSPTPTAQPASTPPPPPAPTAEPTNPPLPEPTAIPSPQPTVTPAAQPSATVTPRPTVPPTPTRPVPTPTAASPQRGDSP